MTPVRRATARILVVGTMMSAFYASAAVPPQQPVGPKPRSGEDCSGCADAGPIPIATVEPVVSPLVHHGGTVVARVTVGPDGEVTEVDVLTPVAALVEPVVAALKQWRFQPGRVAGKRATTCSIVAVHVKFQRHVVGDGP